MVENIIKYQIAVGLLIGIFLTIFTLMGNFVGNFLWEKIKSRPKISWILFIIFILSFVGILIFSINLLINQTDFHNLFDIFRTQ